MCRYTTKGTSKHEIILHKWPELSTHGPPYLRGNAVLLIKMKVDPLTMRDLLGHSNLSSTMTYVHLEAEATEYAVLDSFSKLNVL